MKAANKVVVVTGAGSGMGRQVVLELVRRGAKVAAVDINAAAAAETATLAGSSVQAFMVNVADRAQVEALPAQVIGSFGAVDGVIHCAGIIQPFVKLNELDWPAMEKVFAVNWWGTLYLTKAFLPHLLARPEAHVVNIASMGGFLPVPGQTIYGASKAAVKLLTEALHSELQGTKVGVTVVFPGAVATNITQNSGVATPSMGGSTKAPSVYPAERAANDIVNGMERGAFRVLVGPDAKFLDKFYRLAPRRAAAFIANAMKSLLGH